jgi:hypothetical protein
MANDDAMPIVVDNGNYIHHCTLNCTSTVVTNRSALFASIYCYEDTICEYNWINGGPQGGVRVRGADCFVRFNLIQQDARVSNGYGVETWQEGTGITCSHNTITPANGRGIHVASDNGSYTYNYIDVKEDPALNPEYSTLTTQGIKVESDDSPFLFGTGNTVSNNTVIARSSTSGFPTALNVTLHDTLTCTITDNYFEAVSTVATPEDSYAVKVGLACAGVTMTGNTFVSNSYLFGLLVPATGVVFTNCTFNGTDTPIFYDGSGYIDTESDTLFSNCSYDGVDYLDYEFPSPAVGWDADQEFTISGVVRVEWDSTTGTASEIAL